MIRFPQMQDVQQELDDSRRGIDFTSETWAAVNRYLHALRWETIMGIGNPQSEQETERKRCKLLVIERLMQLSEISVAEKNRRF